MVNCPFIRDSQKTVKIQIFSFSEIQSSSFRTLLLKNALFAFVFLFIAAHCFKLDTQNIPPSAMVVSLGRYQLRDFYEAGSVNMEIARYTIHPDYQETGDSDLAILVLRNPVEFSPTIKPICMWNGPIDLQSAINKIGYVVGWGQNEFGNLQPEPRMAKVPIVSQVKLSPI